ncbi:MAG: glycosyltransferase [Terriglobales bacterium]|jgi:glycosyltransferase involved in cell wall biosynthesis
MSHDDGRRGGAAGRPEVSVLLPVHNGGVQLPEAIDSILGQTFSDFELVIVDDASTDSTAAYLASLQDPRVRVLRNERNLGVARSLNRAIRESSGEYIARQDADDVSEPTRLARQVKILNTAPNVGIVATAARWIDGQGNVIKHFCPTSGDDLDVRWRLLFNNVLPHTSVMARRTAIKDGYSESADTWLVEDYELWNRVARTHHIVTIPEELVRFRWQASSLSELHSDSQTKQRGEVRLREARELVGGYLPRNLYEDFLAIYFVGAEEFPQLSGERVRAATDFATKLQAAFYARSGRMKFAVLRHRAKVRFHWAAHLLRLAVCAPQRDLRWRASVVTSATRLMFAG